MTKITLQKIKKNKGFVILFAVTIASILLAIALGVAGVALKEINFSTSAKDTNEAFFAADTGLEYVLFLDKPPTSAYVLNVGSEHDHYWYDIPVTGLGSTGKSCAKVTIGKINVPPISTVIISKGYNTGSVGSACTPPPNSIERQLESRY